MTELNRWKCDICGTVHENKADCVKCEEGHAGVCGVEYAQYSSGENYPHCVTVKFNNGTRLIYKL